LELVLGKEEIANLIPHSGNMCLLDGVIGWDEAGIRCISTSHTDAANPMARNGRLSAICGLEYAAQAMAVHGGLAGDVEAQPRMGLLVSVRNLVCRTDRLDRYEGPLIVRAGRLFGERERVIYEFSLHVGDSELMAGRATAVLQQQFL